MENPVSNLGWKPKGALGVLGVLGVGEECDAAAVDPSPGPLRSWLFVGVAPRGEGGGAAWKVGKLRPWEAAGAREEASVSLSIASGAESRGGNAIRSTGGHVPMPAPAWIGSSPALVVRSLPGVSGLPACQSIPFVPCPLPSQ